MQNRVYTGKLSTWLRKFKASSLAKINFLRGTLLAKAGKVPAAISAYHACIRWTPEIKLDVRARLRSVIKVDELYSTNSLEFSPKINILDCVNRNEIEDEIIRCRKFIKSNPGNIKGYVFLGDALSLVGKHKESDNNYRSAILLSAATTKIEDFDSLVIEKQNNDTLIITHVAINYFPMFKVWFNYFKKMKINNLLVISLDPIVYGKLKVMGVDTYLHPIFSYQPNIRSFLWYEILKLRKRINSLNINYLHTDIDAIWFKNPLDIIEGIHADIVGSIAYGTPKELFDKWGFVICGGFYFMRSTDSTRNMYDDYIAYTKVDLHDQNGLNRLLNDSGINWKTRGLDLIGRCDKLKLDVNILHDSIVSRTPEVLDEKNTLYVFHPVLAGSGAEKLNTLIGYGVSDVSVC